MKRSKLILVISCWMSLTIVSCFGAEPKERVEAFLSSVLKGDVDKSYDILLQGSFLAQEKASQITMLKGQTKVALPTYGKLLGFESVSDTLYGKSTRKIVYVLKAEKHPLVWIFFFYKATDTWVVSTVFFNDEFKGL